MAVVNCRECGKSVSTEAAACPHCGAPQNAGVAAVPAAKPKKKMGILAWIGLIFLALFVIGMIVGPEEQKGQSASPSAAAAVEPATPVTAAELFNEYQANEVAADQQFKGKRLEVTGTVQDIKKDFSDSIYLVLRTPNQFMGVHASLDDKHQNLAASLKQGQKVTLTCTGGGMVVGSPMLRKCEP